MKLLFFIFSLLLVNNITGVAQCGKKVILSSSETFYIDSSGTVKRTVPEKSVVQINPSEVTINQSGRYAQ